MANKLYESEIFVRIIRASDWIVLAEGTLNALNGLEDDICATIAQLQGTKGRGGYPRVRMGTKEENNGKTFIQIEIDTGENDERYRRN